MAMITLTLVQCSAGFPQCIVQKANIEATKSCLHHSSVRDVPILEDISVLTVLVKISTICKRVKNSRLSRKENLTLEV